MQRITQLADADVRADALGPSALVDFVIVAMVRQRANVAAFDPSGDATAVSLRRGNGVLMELRVASNVAHAAVARVARIAGLDPLVDDDVAGGARASRLRIEVGEQLADVLVSMSASRFGLCAELRLVAIDGREVEHPTSAQLKVCATCGAYQPVVRNRCEVDGGVLRPLEDDPKPGGTIGVYRVHEALGAGAMGTVFAGEHALIGRKVAIKVLHAPHARNAQLAARFLSEARAASRLRHSSIVEVTDYGVLASGAAFIVMERLEGESLDDRLMRSPLASSRAALAIVRAIAVALAVAHDGGVVHNDLKPSNVMMLRESTDKAPLLKVVDFGAAWFAGAAHDEAIIGTPIYMAPERIRGDRGDARADVYSLGIMLYEMLSGAPPFYATRPTEIFSAHLRDAPPPITTTTGALPRAVANVVARALAKRPSERYQNMTELVNDIDNAISVVDGPDWRRWLP